MTDERDPRDGELDGAEQEQRARIRVTDRRKVSEPDADDASPEPEVQDISERGDDLAHELEEAKNVADERYQQMLRLKADFENYRKRVLREQTELVERASERIVERLLPVLDDLDRALQAAGSSPDPGLVKGVEMVRAQLLDVLGAEGLERVAREGEPFDHNQHDAVASTPGGVEEPTVLEVVRPGYRLKDRTIRPALVHVATPDASPEDAEPEEGSG